MAPILATTITLDVARSYRINGQLIDIFKGNLQRTTSSGGLRPSASPNSYEAQLQWALEEFRKGSVPCSCRDISGRRCVNTKRGHRYPFHQTRNGFLLGFGTFNSKEVNELMDNWMLKVETQIQALLAELESTSTCRDSSTSATRSQPARLEEKAVWAWHSQGMSLLFRENPTLRLDCPLMCCSCLQNLPFEILPCGHSVCDACIPLLACSTSNSDLRVVPIQNCILHNSAYQFDLVPPVQHYSHWAIGASGQPIGAPNTSRRFGSYLPIGWQEGYSPSGLALSPARQSEPEYESEV